MGKHQKAKLFSHGGSQAVRLPKAFRFEGLEVRIEREGDRVVLTSDASPKSGPALWDEIDRLRGEGQLGYPAQPMIEELTLD